MFPAAIYVAILDSRLTDTLPTDVSAAALKAGLPKSSLVELLKAITAGAPAAMKAVPGINAQIIAAATEASKTAYSQAFSTVFLASIAFGGLAIIASLVSVPIDGEFNNVVAAKLSGVTRSSDEEETFNMSEGPAK